TVDRAVEAAWALPSLAGCADREALEAQHPPPDDPALAREVAAIDDELNTVELWAELGRHDDAARLVATLVERADSLDHAPLQARAWLLHGRMLVATSDYAAAEPALERAYELAVAQRMTELSARAAI